MSIASPAIQTPTVDVPLPMIVVSSSAQPSSSTPLDVASLYSTFDADAMAYDPTNILPAIVAGYVATTVTIKANIPNNVAADSSEPYTVVLMTGLVAYEPLSSAPRADLGEGGITPIPFSHVIDDETNPHAAIEDVPPPDRTRLTNNLKDEEVTDATQPIATQPYLEVREILSDLWRHLSDPVEAQVNDSGSIRARFDDILNSLSSDLVDVLTPVTYLEYYRPLRVEQADLVTRLVEVHAKIAYEEPRGAVSPMPLTVRINGTMQLRWSLALMLKIG
ncbi:hypothetical protein GUJ93_ZPchr0013g34056 [Zizania palustris]|uniref:DUF1409 domain-containing protein n=1 Tax=Zizania palustris TaxID=103762 RepID=A0A8J5X0F1_ZIZPA|nr:hypothetical protein GUJ93_ZPchr0013g34056 [Zizania palustris]